MFKVTVINIKEITKYLIGVSCTIFIVGILAKTFSESNKSDFFHENTKKMIDKINEQSLIEVLNNEIPGIDEINYETKLAVDEDDHSKEGEISDQILDLGLGKIYYNDENKNVKESETNKDNTSENNEEQSQDNVTNNEVKVASTENAQTEVVTKNPLKNVVTNTFQLVNIKNESCIPLNDDILNPNISFSNKSILIYHTHTCESYTQSDKYQYTPTGNYRTTDLNYSVAKVGDELEKYLKKYNLDVDHDKTYHDYPAYTGSYTRSLKTVQNILNSKKYDIIIDLHRDAVGGDNSYAPTVQINGEYAAQIMFVMGTNGGGLTHENWQTNLKFAVKVQQKAEEMYPRII